MRQRIRTTPMQSLRIHARSCGYLCSWVWCVCVIVCQLGMSAVGFACVVRDVRVNVPDVHDLFLCANSPPTFHPRMICVLPHDLPLPFPLPHKRQRQRQRQGRCDVCTYLSFLVSDIYIFSTSTLFMDTFVRRSSFVVRVPPPMSTAPSQCATVLGTGGIMYSGGNIMSGPQDSLVDLLMPSKTEDLDKVCDAQYVYYIV